MAKLLLNTNNQSYHLQDNEKGYCFDLTHDKMYAIEFEEQPISNVYAYSFTTERCYPLKRQTTDEEGKSILAWGGLDGPRSNLQYPFEMLLKFLLRGMASGGNLASVLGGKGYTDRLICFTVDRGKVVPLRKNTDEHIITTRGVGTFQDIIMESRNIVQRLSNTNLKEIVQEKLQETLVTMAMKNKFMFFKFFIQNLRDGTAMNIRNFVQGMRTFMGWFGNRLRKGARGVYNALTFRRHNTQSAKGGTRKRHAHCLKRHPHRRPPASTQRRRLAKRTRRRNRVTALLPARST